MKSIFNIFINLMGNPKKFRKPHVCEYKCVGYCSHYGQITEISQYIENPSWGHYPSAEKMKWWQELGFDYARVFQSHWKCSCGKHQTFFFLAKPFIRKNSNGFFTESDTVISQNEYDLMTNHNPFELGSSCGKSLTEVTNSLVNELC